jgi:CRP/FNR family transcriptional regulator, cyclic AMP receptor protein
MVQTLTRGRGRAAVPVVDLREVLSLAVGPRVPVRTSPVPRGRAGADRFGGPMLLVEGAILRIVRLEHRTSAVLYGPGEVVPGAQDQDGRFTAAGRALVPSSVVSLGPANLAALAAAPDAVAEVVARVDRKLGELGVQAILTQLVSIRERLQLLLPQLSERWGTVTAEGVLLPAFLSHSVLAALVGVRRPSLTTALAELAATGHMARLDDRRWRISPALAGL